ncbi:hypothetical protein IK112_00085 [Candidatus Saccharibacteria bacterium]|nr:hypothetical protein [Candidatus Saccharibacteria bacterium]
MNSGSDKLKKELRSAERQSHFLTTLETYIKKLLVFPEKIRHVVMTMPQEALFSFLLKLLNAEIIVDGHTKLAELVEENLKALPFDNVSKLDVRLVRRKMRKYAKSTWPIAISAEFNLLNSLNFMIAVLFSVYAVAISIKPSIHIAIAATIVDLAIITVLNPLHIALSVKRQQKYLEKYAFWVSVNWLLSDPAGKRRNNAENAIIYALSDVVDDYSSSTLF